MIDALVLGRVAVDLYANEVGVPLKDVRTFSKFLGGSPANIAVGLARLGARVAFIGRVGKDPFGEFLRELMEREGIDVLALRTDEAYPTALAFAEMHPPDHFPLLMYRRPSADTQISVDDIDADRVGSARLLIAAGTNLAESPSREATLHALSLRASTGRRNVFDADLRPAAWKDIRWAALYARMAVSLSDVVLANEEELALLTGDADVIRATEQVLEWGPTVAVAKRGARGVLVRWRGVPGQSRGVPGQSRGVMVRPSGFPRQPSGFPAQPSGFPTHPAEAGLFEVPAIPVQVVNTLGAGDAFAAGFCYGLLQGWPLPEAARLGVAAGAIVAGRHSCSEAMPTLEETKQLLSEARRRDS